MTTVVKTSKEWQEETDILILDPDGWDRGNFQFSYYEEQITLKEFNRRTSESSTKRTLPKITGLGIYDNSKIGK